MFLTSNSQNKFLSFVITLKYAETLFLDKKYNRIANNSASQIMTIKLNSFQLIMFCSNCTYSYQCIISVDEIDLYHRQYYLPYSCYYSSDSKILVKTEGGQFYGASIKVEVSQNKICGKAQRYDFGRHIIH